jgi:hypothetical protein
MVTIQPYQSLNHLASQIGHLMQHYRMFQNLLGLRATEVNIIKRDGKEIEEDDLSLTHKIYLKLSREDSDIFDKQNIFLDTPIENFLKDGDEFVFKLASFDKWVTALIHFDLEDNPEFVLSAKVEMRIAGYYQNSHFFQIITKLIINIWNENIEDMVGKTDYYTIQNIRFRNK